MLTGCQGVNGGGWAHYVGQEKVRPLTGFQQVAFALDWTRPPRHMTGTSFFYLHSDQWRYEAFGPSELASPLGRGLIVVRVILITILSLLPGSWQERTGLPGPVEHFIAYTGTGLILALVLPRRWLWQAAGALAAYSGLMEILQNFSPGRDPAVRDFLVSSAGAFFGAALGWFLLRRRASKD